jgi:hypothetical protein
MIGRREFVLRAAGAAAGLTFARTGIARAVPCHSARYADSDRAGLPGTWAWVHGRRERTPAEWRARFALLRESGIEGLLVGGGDTRVLSDSAHSEGLAFHRWVWTLNRNGDSELQQNHPDWFMVSREGESSLEHPPYVPYYKWLCPTREGARAHVRKSVEAVALDPAVDGVHLDYVRFPDVILPRGLWEKYGLVQDRELPEYDFCYCPACRDEFSSQTGLDPFALSDPPADETWRRFRWDRVTHLVQELSDSVHALGKPISAAVFATPTLARQMVRQAWDEWPLDMTFPMTYHQMYDQPVSWIGDATRQGREDIGRSANLFPGLYLPHLTPAELGSAIDAARGGGASGVSLFESDRLTDDHLAVLVAAVGGAAEPAGVGA